MPIVIYGTGADADAILNYPHSHTYQTMAFKGANNSVEVRQRAAAAGDGQNPADAPVNSDQTRTLDEDEAV
jgi:hypothetical protein